MASTAKLINYPSYNPIKNPFKTSSSKGEHGIAESREIFNWLLELLRDINWIPLPSVSCINRPSSFSKSSIRGQSHVQRKNRARSTSMRIQEYINVRLRAGKVFEHGRNSLQLFSPLSIVWNFKFSNSRWFSRKLYAEVIRSHCWKLIDIGYVERASILEHLVIKHSRIGAASSIYRKWGRGWERNERERG